MTRVSTRRLVLALQPSCRGFGFVVLAGAVDLVDWGLYAARTRRNASCLGRLARLCDAYRPDRLVIEDVDAPDCRRRPRVRDLVARVEAQAIAHGTRVRRVPRRRVLSAFARLGARNKHEIATAVTAILPDLALRLPPPRKPWMSQDERFALFDAAAFALAATAHPALPRSAFHP